MLISKSATSSGSRRTPRYLLVEFSIVYANVDSHRGFEADRKPYKVQHAVNSHYKEPGSAREMQSTIQSV